MKPVADAIHEIFTKGMKEEDPNKKMQ